MSTLVEELIKTYGVDIDPHLDRQALVPVSAGIQRQGDIIVIPAEEAGLRTFMEIAFNDSTIVTHDGFPVVRGEVGGNTHLLLADGDVRYLPISPGAAIGVIGVLRVADEAVGYLAHPEHGYAGIAPGMYGIRRQREFDPTSASRNATRMVAD